MLTSDPKREFPRPSTISKAGKVEVTVLEANRLYRSGASSKTIGFVSAATDTVDSRSKIELDLIAGMALFDQGDIAVALDHLASVELAARQFDVDVQFRSAAALFNRVSEFLSPTASLPILARLRQVAAAKGDANSLGGLHLAVAKLEACRGNYLSSRTHLETARGFEGRSKSTDFRCAISLIDCSLEVLGGNIARALGSARAAYAESALTGSRIQMAGSAGMLGLVSLLTGNAAMSMDYLTHGLELADEVLYMRLGILDNLVQVALWNDDLDRCDEYLKECAAVIAKQTTPSRSWYDLAHQVSRCSVLSSIADWETILEITAEAEPEAERRQFRALRTGLLCASARALGNLGDHKRAESKLASAIRSCPRGAVDPLIVLEATIGVCAALRGEQALASAHFERALSTAKAIGNRLLEAQIGTDQAKSLKTAKSIGVSRDPIETGTNTRNRSLVLADAATILGAGTSIALLAQRAVALIEGTNLEKRLRVRSSSGEEFRPETSVTSHSTADGSTRIELRGSDRCTTLIFDEVSSLDDVALVKGLVDLLQAAVRQRSDGDGTSEERTLWSDAPFVGDGEAVFSSPRMMEIVRVAVRLATSTLPILITGETGTGKEVFAKLIHDNSAAKRGPFVPFNCSAIPRDLVESQLFGHKKGSFTGAIDTSLGVIRSATGGTLFLDEIGDLDQALQPKLLRFIESGEIHSIGEGRPSTVKVRIVAATNANLDELSKDGRFRRDLFFRVGAAQIILPPLRERKDEIPALTTSFINRFSRESSRPRLRVSDDLIAALLLYDWPGNIRQLANELHRIVAMAEPGQTLTSADLSTVITEGWILAPKSGPDTPNTLRINLDQPLPKATEELERAFVSRAMHASGGHVNEAAQLLGISRKGLFLKRRRWGHLDPEPLDPDEIGDE